MNRSIRQIIYWVKSKFYIFSKSDVNKDPVIFGKIISIPSTPNDVDVEEGCFIHVVYKEKSYWVLFKCPCGCGVVISLPVSEEVNKVSWKLEISKRGSPTLYPSIWQKKGCYSHFWLRDGRIHWCEGTGLEPWLPDN